MTSLSYKLERSDVTWGITAVVVLLISLSGANGAFLMAAFGVPAAIVLFFMRLSDSKRRNLVARITVYGSSVLLAVSGPAGCSLATYRTEAVMQPVIAAIEKYHDTHGEYPASLELLSVPIPLCPDPQHKVAYWRADSREVFALICGTYAFNKHTYDSKLKQWQDRD